VTAKYLLPCPCGRQLVVEPRQAGQTIACACGQLLPVPTLLDMTALEPAPLASASPPPRSTWGLKQRFRLLGIVVLLAAVFLGVLVCLGRPVSRFDTIDPDQLLRIAKTLPPSRSWDVWETMKQGLDRRVDQNYLDAMDQFHLKLGAIAGLALLGVGLIAAGAVRARSERSRIGN
jgi:hypothetical protein